MSGRIATWVVTGWAAAGRPQLLPNVALAAWLGADAVRVLLLAEDLAGETVEIAYAVTILAAAGFVLLRPRPLAQDARLTTVAIALSAVLVPGLLSSLAPGGAQPARALAVQLLAILLLGVSILYLGRNFSVLPQYRSLVTGGPYALVRHPIYASYLVFDGALAVASGSALAAGLWLAEAVLLFLRARAEEQLLAGTDAAYLRYKASVLYRFVPFVM